jgi:hypothetical protein
MSHGDHPIDRANQAWVRASGKRVQLDEHPWLLGPIGGVELEAEHWLATEAERLNGSLHDGGGLLNSMSQLESDEFDPSLLAEPVVAFYEQTSRWRLEAWSEWSPVAWPVGWAISNLFGKRLPATCAPAAAPGDGARHGQSSSRHARREGLLHESVTGSVRQLW